MYVFDALCGWCFGFSPTVKHVARALEGEVELEVVSGGLKRGARVGRLDEVAPYIRTAYRDVERATGVRFGRAFLDGPLARGDLVLDSLPPARALAVVKAIRPDLSLEFAAGLHDAIYLRGLQPRDPALASLLAGSLGLDVAVFDEAFASPRSIELAEQDFTRAAVLGVSSYPTLVLVTGRDAVHVSRGAEPFERVLAKVRRALMAAR